MAGDVDRKDRVDERRQGQATGGVGAHVQRTDVPGPVRLELGDLDGPLDVANDLRTVGDAEDVTGLAVLDDIPKEYDTVGHCG